MRNPTNLGRTLRPGIGANYNPWNTGWGGLVSQSTKVGFPTPIGPGISPDVLRYDPYGGGTGYKGYYVYSRNPPEALGIGMPRLRYGSVSETAMHSSSFDPLLHADYQRMSHGVGDGRTFQDRSHSVAHIVPRGSMQAAAMASPSFDPPIGAELRRMHVGVGRQRQYDHLQRARKVNPYGVFRGGPANPSMVYPHPGIGTTFTCHDYTWTQTVPPSGCFDAPYQYCSDPSVQAPRTFMYPVHKRR